MSVRNYTVQTKIGRPVSTVFDAVFNESILCKYFADGSSGPLVEGERIIWSWNEYDATPVVVKQIVVNELIHLEIDSAEWGKTKKTSYKVDVKFKFTKLDDNTTMLAISESGWLTDAEGLKASHDNCSGWTDMATNLKAWIEYKIDLRKTNNFATS